MDPSHSAPHIESATIVQRVIDAVGCKFAEYRGEGKPTVGKPSAKPGDVYFDIKGQPYVVWVCQSDYSWKQWKSMAESKDCKHPHQDRVLHPSVQRIAWVPISGYDGYLRQTRLRLGKRIDAADTHVKIILDQERGIKPAPPQIKAPSPDRAPWSDISSDGNSEDDVEVLVPSRIMSSEAADEDVPIKTETEIMAERRAKLEKRCEIMRVENDKIQNAIRISPGTRYIYTIYYWQIFTKGDRTRQIDRRTWRDRVSVRNALD